MTLAAAFFLGLVGSLHCAAMCGPLTLAVNIGRPPSHQAGYHFGRIIMYGVLGAISGLMGAAIAFAGFQRWMSIAAGCLILLALLTSFRFGWGGLPGKFISLVKAKFARLLGNRSLGATMALGGLNGLLPCGMVYVACAAAATAGSVLGGILTMFAFGLGTAPMLLSIGFAGKAVRWINPLSLKTSFSICAMLAGVLLIMRGIFAPHLAACLDPICGFHR
jgi:hypothetical protein